MSNIDRHRFYSNVFARQKDAHDIPSNVRIWEWARDVFRLMFPERNAKKLLTVSSVQAAFTILENELYDLLLKIKYRSDYDPINVAQEFFNVLPELYQRMLEDAEAMLQGDPAANNLSEVIRTYPGFLAICMYRMAHQLQVSRVPLIPRILTEYAHERTGIDIHPGAKIGRYFHIDHGTGLVIGETAQIGDYVKLYQGVTLGALSVNKILAGIRRHPVIEDHVIVYAGATILGGETRIGHHSVIGGNVWLTESVPAHSRVFNQPLTKIISSNSA